MLAEDVEIVMNAGSHMGLFLKCVKSELIAHKDAVVQDATLQSFSRFETQKALLLGAPLFPGDSLDAAWHARCADLDRAVSRLKLVSSQDALLLYYVHPSVPLGCSIC